MTRPGSTNRCARRKSGGRLRRRSDTRPHRPQKLKPAGTATDADGALCAGWRRPVHLNPVHLNPMKATPNEHY